MKNSIDKIVEKERERENFARNICRTNFKEEVMLGIFAA